MVDNGVIKCVLCIDIVVVRVGVKVDVILCEVDDVIDSITVEDCVGLPSSSSSSSSSPLDDCLAEGVELGDSEDVEVLDTEDDDDGIIEFVDDGLAPVVNEDVGVEDIDLDKVCVELGVIDDVAVPLIVADGVDVMVAVNELVILSEFELLAGVFEGLEPRLIDADDEKEIDEVSVIVEEAVSDGVAVPETVALAVGVTEGVFKALIVDEGVIGGETVALNEMEGVPLAVSPNERVLVGVIDIVVDRLATIDSLPLPELVPVEVCDVVLEPVPVEELVGLFEGEVDDV